MYIETDVTEGVVKLTRSSRKSLVYSGQSHSEKTRQEGQEEKGFICLSEGKDLTMTQEIVQVQPYLV